VTINQLVVPVGIHLYTVRHILLDCRELQNI